MTFPIGCTRTREGYALATRAVGHGPLDVVIPNGGYYVDDLSARWTSRAAQAYDLRNRGASESLTTPAHLERGVLNDVDDLELVRQHLGLERMALIGHSYVAEVVMLYAMAHPTRVSRAVLFGPSGYCVGHAGPPPPDALAVDVLGRLAELMRTPATGDGVERCRSAWGILAPLYVADPALAHRVQPFGRCDLANERAFLGYWMRYVEPSLRRLAVIGAEIARVDCPVLVVHGDRDRSAPAAAGRAWSERLPNARRLDVKNVAHAPWIEAPDLVLPALDVFLDGGWPATTERDGAGAR